jgi:hypothetical protein
MTCVPQPDCCALSVPLVLSIFQTVLKTVRLDVRQWLICTVVALSIVVAAEIRKAVLRQTAAKAIHPQRPGPEPLTLNARRVPDTAEYTPAWQMAAAAGWPQRYVLIGPRATIRRQAMRSYSAAWNYLPSWHAAR